MLRVVVPSSRWVLQGAPRRAPAVQWSSARAVAGLQREFADFKKTADQTVLPGSQSKAADKLQPAPVILTPSTPTISPNAPPQNIPLAPPTPEAVNAVAPRPTPTAKPVAPASPPPPTQVPLGTGSAATGPPPPPPKKKRRGLRFLSYTIALLGLSFAGGTYYSLVNDNFHDFFTEYVPYGEEAVGYFEERAYKARFPESGMGSVTSKMYPQVKGEKKVTIPGNSGMAPRLAENTSDLSSNGPHVSALDRDSVAPRSATSGKTAVTSRPQEASPGQKDRQPKTVVKAEPEAKFKPAIKAETKPGRAPAPAPAAPPAPAAASASARPIVPIDPMRIDNAADPFVQEVTKMLNDVIQVVNADNASDRYSSTIQKAKEDVQKLAHDIADYRTTQSLAAEQKIKGSQIQFDNAAKELLSRVREEQKEQELRWRDEYEIERERLAKTYQEKLDTELGVARKIAEQRLQNDLLEQDIKLKDTFSTSVRDRIETERGARLSKLGELSSTVSELESLTTKWNEVVESNLKTQHLVVAVEAVRSVLNNADRPTPFVHQLVALKEISSDDPVVTAAIASINPTAYQRGIPTTAQLIDRFRGVASEVRKASLLPEDAGVASHAASFVLSKLMFKKQGLAVGDDVESILTRTATLLEEGALDEAAREMNGLNGWAKVLSRDWLIECRKVLEVRQALDVIATETRRQSLMVE